MSHNKEEDAKDQYDTLVEKITEKHRANILVVALVYAAGTEKERFTNPLKCELKRTYSYKEDDLKDIKISALIKTQYTVDKNSKDKKYRL